MRDRTSVGGIRTRWAAIGAAVAVALGGGAVQLAHATINSGTKNVVVTVSPSRVVDTTASPKLGLSSVLTTGVGRTIRVTGSISTSTGTRTVVPTTATAVIVNVTAVSPTASGSLTVRNADTTGTPTVPTMSVAASRTETTGVTVSIPTSGTNAGKVNLWYQSSTVGATTNVRLDIIGYTTDHTHDDRYYTKTQIDTALSGKADTGVTTGLATRITALELGNVITVADSGGDFSTIAAALNSITTSSPGNPYLVRVAPGIYDGIVTLRDNVTVEGAGPGVTVLTNIGEDTVVLASEVTGAALRSLSVVSTGEAAIRPIDLLFSEVEVSDVHVIAQASASAEAIRVGSSEVDLEDIAVEVVAPIATGIAIGNSLAGLHRIDVVADGDSHATGIDLNETSNADVSDTDVRAFLETGLNSTGVQVRNESVAEFDGLDTTGAFAMYVDRDSVVQVRNSSITEGPGGAHALQIDDDADAYSTRLDISFSMLSGSVDLVAGAVSCFSVHDGTNTGVSATCGT